MAGGPTAVPTAVYWYRGSCEDVRRVWETAEARPCQLASAARHPRRGRIRTRATPSRLRAIAARKPRDETRPSGGEIAEKQLYGAVIGARVGDRGDATLPPR